MHSTEMMSLLIEHDAYALLEALMDCVGDWYKYTDDKVKNCFLKLKQILVVFQCSGVTRSRMILD
jgi:hypothetical protein